MRQTYVTMTIADAEKTINDLAIALEKTGLPVLDDGVGGHTFFDMNVWGAFAHLLGEFSLAGHRATDHSCETVCCLFGTSAYRLTGELFALDEWIEYGHGFDDDPRWPAIAKLFAQTHTTPADVVRMFRSITPDGQINDKELAGAEVGYNLRGERVTLLSETVI